jgi:type II secretory pathway pseudopilin PulG
MTLGRIAHPAVRGFTLVELIMFIVIMGVVAAAMVQAFSGTVRGSHTGKEMTQAIELAQQRMEVIAGQRKLLGYSGFNTSTYDPCDSVGLPAWTTQPCATTTYQAGSFNVSSNPISNFASDACGAGTGTNCKEVTVTVTAPDGGTLARLTAQFWNY